MASKRSNRIAISVTPEMDELVEQVRRAENMSSKAEAAYRLMLRGLDLYERAEGLVTRPEPVALPEDEAALLESYRSASDAHRASICEMAELFAAKDSHTPRRSPHIKTA